MEPMNRYEHVIYVIHKYEWLRKAIRELEKEAAECYKEIDKYHNMVETGEL